MRAVEAGYDVIAPKLNLERVKRRAAGNSDVGDVTDETLRAALTSERYRPSAEPGPCENFDVAVITVPTPLRAGTPDLSFIEDAAVTVGHRLDAGATVVLESTTYPGTTVDVLIPILETRSGLRAGPDFHVGYSPERIDPGNRPFTLPPRQRRTGQRAGHVHGRSRCRRLGGD